MKKYFVFVLIFFLFFSLYFKLAKASTTSCHVYIDGICQTWYYFESEEYEEQIQETVEAPRSTMREAVEPSAEFSTKFLTLAFQFLGIVFLSILLIVVVEELIKSAK